MRTSWKLFKLIKRALKRLKKKKSEISKQKILVLKYNKMIKIQRKMYVLIRRWTPSLIVHMNSSTIPWAQELPTITNWTKIKTKINSTKQILFNLTSKWASLTLRKSGPRTQSTKYFNHTILLNLQNQRLRFFLTRYQRKMIRGVS